MTSSHLLSCSLAGKCSGCPWIEKPDSVQHQEKRDHFLRRLNQAVFCEEAISSFHILSTKHAELRDRIDLILESEEQHQKLGLYDLDKKTLLDLTACPILTGPMESWLQDFKQDLPKIRKGSLRLRVSPQGTRGVWLDFSNQDIKRLLEESQWLERLQSRAIVEIGQKRKRLIRKENRWALGEPVLSSWSDTFYGETPLPLFTPIGGFTQSGPEATKVLSQVFLTLLPNEVSSWVELGSGSGTFTLPLLAAGKSVQAIEMDPLSLSGLLQSATHLGKADALVTHQLDFNRDREAVKFLIQDTQGVVADPPRSGLGNILSVLRELEHSKRPSYFVSISCWEDSFVSDTMILQELGYVATRLIGVDQFPQTPHFEILALFQKENQ